MTEAEAKTKRCPAGVGEFAIVGGGTEGPRLRTFRATCIGSACMAWRPENSPPEDVTQPGGIPATFTWSGTHGRCGLAGK